MVTSNASLDFTRETNQTKQRRKEKMKDNKVTTLSEQESRVKELEGQLANERAQFEKARVEKLDNLHQEVPGIHSTEELIEALLNRVGKTALRRFTSKSGGGNRGSRIPEEVKKNALAEVKAGNLNDKEVAEKFGISGPTLYNWKKKAGMTNPRKKQTAQAA